MTSIISTAKQAPSIVSMGVKVFVVSSPAPTKSDERSAQPIQGLSKRAQAIAGPRVWGRINVQGRK